MLAQRRARRRRRLILLGAAVAVAAAANLAGVGPAVVGRPLDAIAPRGAATPTKPATGVLLAVPSESDPHAAFVLVGPGADGETPVTLIPGATQVEVPSLGSRTLTEALAAGGPRAARVAVANALGVRVGGVVVVEPEVLGSAFGASGLFRVRLREPVEVAGRPWAAGEHEVGATHIAALVAAPSDDGFGRLLVLHAILEGWLESADSATVDAAAARLADGAEAGGTSVATAVTALRRQGARFDTLDVDTVTVPGSTRYTVTSAGEKEVAEAFDHLVTSRSERPKVEILNGTGAPGLAMQVAERIVPEGFRVVLTGNAKDFGHQETVLVVHDEHHEAAARRLAGTLGVGVLRTPSDPVSVVDISIVVGADFGPGGE